MVEKITQPLTPLQNTEKINEIIDNFADKNLSNLSAIGQEILDNKLNKQMISNCITEIPQDIKLELSNGTLTLKAGSKVYVPNGANTFDVVNITSDKVFNSTDERKWFLAYDVDNGVIFGNYNTSVNIGSGITEPPAGFYGFYYNTSTNLLYDYRDGVKNRKCSLPFCIVSSSTSSWSIDQVFNGFGYIGSTVFALPGVKGLIPNGRNEDGTLKNIEFINPVVKTYSVNGTYNNLKMVLATTGIGVYYYAYDDIKNAIYRTDTGAYFSSDRFIVADISFTNSRITSLQPKTTFNSVDYNDAVLNYGDQNISGNKNLTGTLTIVKDKNVKDPLFFKNPNTTYGVSPNENIYTELKFIDKDDNFLCSVKHSTFSNGGARLELLLRSPNNGDNYQATGVGFLSDGTPYSIGVNPPTNSNSNSTMPTTGWTRTVCVGNPNYNAAVSRTVGTTYTAATNGWVRVDSVQRDNTTCKLIIDGAHTPYQVFCGEYFDGNIAVIIPVVKGQKYKGENLVSMWWYPSI